MTQLLTDAEINAIDPDGLREGFARAIEAAVLAKLREQEPVVWVSEDTCDGQFINNKKRRIWWECNEGVGTPLYAHPMPPDDVIRDAERYQELLYAVQRKFPDESRHETALRYIKHAEAPSYSNSAQNQTMKESK